MRLVSRRQRLSRRFSERGNRLLGEREGDPRPKIVCVLCVAFDWVFRLFRVVRGLARRAVTTSDVYPGLWWGSRGGPREKEEILHQ